MNREFQGTEAYSFSSLCERIKHYSKIVQLSQVQPGNLRWPIFPRVPIPGHEAIPARNHIQLRRIKIFAVLLNTPFEIMKSQALRK